MSAWRASAARIGRRVCLFMLFCAGCAAQGGAVRVPRAASTESAPVEQTQALHYELRVNAELSVLEARVCFEGAPPSDLVCGVHWADRYLARVSFSSRGGPVALSARDCRIDLVALSPGDCVHYAIDLAALSSQDSLDGGRRGDALITNVATWLWRPRHWQAIPKATARWQLPAGMRVSVPWKQDAERFVLDASVFAFIGYAAIGRFEVQHVEAPGAVIEVAVLDGLSPQTRNAVVPWVSAAADMAALPTGRFPHERALVVVVPVASADELVPFGMVARGGGPSAGMLLAKDAEAAPLLRDWVLVHEFSHLLAPFVRREGMWLSEGLATYYQEILRVRAGLLPTSEAWKRLLVGAQRGKSAEQSLEKESARVYQTHSFPMVYWAGAAFALMADVELRHRTHGQRSLDDVMTELSTCCASQPRMLPINEVIEHMDRTAGQPIFSSLMKRWVKGRQLPDLQSLYDELGIVVNEDTTRYEERPKAWIRDAIMTK